MAVFKALLASALVAACAASPASPAPGYDYQAEPVQPPVYNFQYGVNDPHYGPVFSHTENRDNYETAGEYRVNLPDGRVQIVSYKAGPDGYVADVRYEGEATYPDTPAYKPHQKPAPAPYKPAPAPYKPAPAPYKPTPAPYKPAPAPYKPAHTPYKPAPSPYKPAPAPYRPAPAHYRPAPAHYKPAPAHYKPAPYHPAPTPIYHPTPAYYPSPAPYKARTYSFKPVEEPKAEEPKENEPALDDEEAAAADEAKEE